MKQYLFIIVVIITITVFIISYNKTIEPNNSQLPDSNQVVIDTSESLRDFLGKMRYICNLNENSIYENIKPNVCYKIYKLYSYFHPIKGFLDNKTEEEIMETYGPEEQQEIAGQKVGEPKPTPIIGSNYDYYTVILLSTYMKLLQPYNDYMWNQTDNSNPPNITSICNHNDNDSIQFRQCASNMLTDIKYILTYFQYQTDTTNAVSYGDGADNGTGAVPVFVP